MEPGCTYIFDFIMPTVRWKYMMYLYKIIILFDLTIYIMRFESDVPIHLI